LLHLPGCLAAYILSVNSFYIVAVSSVTKTVQNLVEH